MPEFLAFWLQINFTAQPIAVYHYYGPEFIFKSPELNLTVNQFQAELATPCMFLIDFTPLFFLHYYTMLAWLAVYRLVQKTLGFFGEKSLIQVNPLANAHPHALATVEQVRLLSGFTLDEHQFQTADGAHVLMWRVRNEQTQKNCKSFPVVLQHGLLDCSTTWFMQSDKKSSLPYLLAEQGHDVWIGNNRGNRFTSKHKNQAPHNYWEFTFDHLAQYDLPAIIEGVLAVTAKQKIVYIGHSQGSTQFIMGLGLHPNLQHKIAYFVGLGTVASMRHVKCHLPLIWLSKLWILEGFLMIGLKSLFVLPHRLTRAIGILVSNISLYQDISIGIVNMLCGTPKVNKIPRELLGAILAHEPGGSSIKNVVQWIQCYRNGRFSKFDYGQHKNLELYGHSVPPEYCLKHLKHVPFNCCLFRGMSDAVMSDEDFQALTSHFTSTRISVQQVQDYGHLDYLWSQTARADVYERLCQLIEQETCHGKEY